MKYMDKETDALRLNDLVRQYRPTFRRRGTRYRFDDCTARGLRQALGVVQGYDRAVKAMAAVLLEQDVILRPMGLEGTGDA